jgi:uncharacterized membrane protein YcaP (DUF421 family)
VWNLSLPWWEFAARGLITYVFMLVLLRLTGKRQVGQLAPFDLVLLLILSNAVQNAMNGGDNSVGGAMILAVTLVAANSAVGWLTAHNRTLERLIEGQAQVLIRNGHVDHNALRACQLTIHELDAALRANGCVCPTEVRLAVLENSGEISVIPRERKLARDTTPG